MKQTVLVTGSAGRLGRAVVAALHPHHTVIGFDLRPTPGIPEGQSVVGSLLDDALMAKAMEGVGCVIHLAATPDDSPTSPELASNFEGELLPNNLLGGYRVLEAARRAGVRRLLLASTGQVIDGHLEDRATPVTATAPYRPRFLYACTKVFLEMAGRVYAEQFGLEVLAVRLGWCPRDAGHVAAITADPEAQDVFLSPGDAGRFFRAAVEVPKLPTWAAVYATSKPVRHLLYDLEPAEKLLGWKPAEQWPTGAESSGSRAVG
jgi:uronate dehydrogenase